MRVEIIGAGNWGTSLAAASGGKIIRHAGWNRYVPSGAVVWLCVADRDIAATAENLAAKIAEYGVRPRAVLHSSGSLTSELLLPVRAAGVPAGSAHPWMTFPTRRPVPLKGVLFGVEGDAAAVRAAAAIVRGFGGRTFPLRAETKALYHAFAVFSGPLLVAQLAAAEAVAEHAGLQPRLARTLLTEISGAVLRNYARHGAEKSYSGPLVRGDAETLTRHLASLKGSPEQGVYLALARYAMEHLPAKRVPALRKALKG